MAISGPETFRKSEDVRMQELSRELLYAPCFMLFFPGDMGLCLCSGPRKEEVKVRTLYDLMLQFCKKYVQ